MTATIDHTPPVEPPSAKLPGLLPRLERQSLERHHDAYGDIAWDDPELSIGPDDLRLPLFAFDPLAATEWYQAQPPEVQGRIGMHRACAALKVGMQFENLLQRGLLARAFRLPNGAAEYRYLHHEVIEESQHSLMFQELINRTGMPVRGMPRSIRLLSTIAVPFFERFFPEQFFVLVLGGEDPVDHVQRRQLREGTTHPLLERIMRIHVTEEARHIAFARTYLKDLVPTLPAWRRHLLAVRTPIVLGIMTPLMVDPSRELARHHGVPTSVLREARTSPAARQQRKDAVAKLRRMCRELGLMTPAARLAWRAVGLADDDAARTQG